jgi:hypothetical protein
MADGNNEGAVDMPQGSWIAKRNIARPYTEAEHKMMKSAFKTVDSEYEHTGKDHRSHEPDDTHKVSPMRDRGPIKRKQS